MRYAPRTEAANNTAVYWKPGAFTAPQVPYPGSAPAAAMPRGPVRPRTVAPAAPSQSPEQHFMVNTGGWSGSMPRGWNEAGPLNPAIYKNHTINMGGAGGGGYASPSELANKFQEALDKANQANEARYQDILGGYQSRYERGLDLLKGLGQQESRDINQIHDGQAAATRQRLVDRGLMSSSVLDTMLSGVERERTADLGRLNDRVRQQAMATDAGLSGDTLQFMERKHENKPDIDMMIKLAQGLGAGGGAKGVGGGGYMSPGAMQGADVEYFNPYAGVLNKAQGIRNLNAAMAMSGMGRGFGRGWDPLRGFDPRINN